MDAQRDDRIFPTEAGASDGIVGNDEPLTGKGGKAAQEAASDGYEELGALREGKSGDAVHHADMGAFPADDHRIFPTEAGASDGVVGNDEPLTGHAGKQVQEAASDSYEELGALLEGKSGDAIHHADMEQGSG